MNPLLERFGKVRQNFVNIKNNPEFVQQLKLFQRSWHIIVPGQVCRLVQIDGEYVFPQFIRHHLSNTADGVMVAGLAGIAYGTLKSVVSDEYKSRPVLSGAFALAVLGGYEAITSYFPGHSGFDSIDMTLHALSVSAYIVASKMGLWRPEAQSIDREP